MDDVTNILHRIEQGDLLAADELLPRVYEELRRLAAQKMAQESPGQTIQATGLVHESYLRLVHSGPARQWESRGHFFAAAARAMRQILVERARKKKTVKHGGDRHRIELVDQLLAAPGENIEFLALDAALTEMEEHDAKAARLVELRYFTGLTHQEAAEAVGLTRRAADRLWALARAWLYRRMAETE